MVHNFVLYFSMQAMLREKRLEHMAGWQGARPVPPSLYSYEMEPETCTAPHLLVQVSIFEYTEKKSYMEVTLNCKLVEMMFIFVCTEPKR